MEESTGVHGSLRGSTERGEGSPRGVHRLLRSPGSLGGPHQPESTGSPRVEESRESTLGGEESTPVEESRGVYGVDGVHGSAQREGSPGRSRRQAWRLQRSRRGVNPSTPESIRRREESTEGVHVTSDESLQESRGVPEESTMESL